MSNYMKKLAISLPSLIALATAAYAAPTQDLSTILRRCGEHAGVNLTNGAEVKSGSILPVANGGTGAASLSDLVTSAMIDDDTIVNADINSAAGITSAKLASGSAKRQVFVARLAPETGVCADATAYRAMIYPGRAGTVTRISYMTHVDPVSGTNVITVQKAAFGGNSMFDAASVSLNGKTADTGVQATLTATSADLGLTAAQAVCCEYNAGTQGTDAEQVTVAVEFEPTDF